MAGWAGGGARGPRDEEALGIRRAAGTTGAWSERAQGARGLGTKGPWNEWPCGQGEWRAREPRYGRAGGTRVPLMSPEARS